MPGNPPPDRYFDLNQGVTPLTGTVLHQPLKFATFGNPLRPTLDAPLALKRKITDIITQGREIRARTMKWEELF